MYIIDSKNKQIDVTDLDAAIRQVDIFVTLTHQNPEFKTFDRELRKYWKDIQQKLYAVKLAQDKFNILPTSFDPKKEKWMKDFIATMEEVTDLGEIEEFLHAYASKTEWELNPDVLYVFEGSYFFTLKEGVFRTNYCNPREFDSIKGALQYIAELEWQDSNGMLLIHLSPEDTQIESVKTEYKGGKVFNDVIVLKDGTTLRISEETIAVFKDQKETNIIGEIVY